MTELAGSLVVQGQDPSPLKLSLGARSTSLAAQET